MELRVRVENLRAHGLTRGWTNDAALAEAIGVPRGTLSRYLSGLMQPGGKFLAGVMFRAFPDVDPREFVEPVDPPKPPAPTGPTQNSRRRN